jgi:virulence factor Mce-like protein
VSPVTPRRAVAALLVLLALAGAAGCGAQPMRISARFADSVGLYVGNDVSVLGVKVGSVTAIHPHGTYLTVEMNLDPDVKIPAGAAAVLVSPSVVTDRRVELTPVYRGGPTLRDGDLIPLDRTRTPVEIDRVFAAADRLASQLNTVAAHGGRAAFADALGVAADTFAGNGEKLRRSLHGLAEAIDVGAQHRDQLVTLIRDVDQLSATAANNDATIRSFSTNLTEATALADEQGPNLRRILDNLDELLDRTERLIRENASSGQRSLDNLRVTARSLADHTRELAEAADVLPTAFANLAAIVDHGRRRARIHASIEQPLLDTQLLGDLCRRYGPPPLCADKRFADPRAAALARLILGGRA